MHRATAAIDDTKTPIPTPHISPWPEGTATRLGVAMEDCLHTWDHYGQLVEYPNERDRSSSQPKVANRHPEHFVWGGPFDEWTANWS